MRDSLDVAGITAKMNSLQNEDHILGEQEVLGRLEKQLVATRSQSWSQIRIQIGS